MPSTTSLRAAALLALGLAGLPAHASLPAEPLYAFGADDYGLGNVFTRLGGSSSAVGDGSLAFNGGLTWGGGNFYAIGNDSLGNSWLTSFGTGAPSSISMPIALGSGFTGGLAASTGGLYAIGFDGVGASTLYSVGAGGASAVGSLGAGYYSGLTWGGGAFYAIGSDDLGIARRVTRIDLGGGTPTATTLFDLGDGSLAFNGGLAWDAAHGRFLVIGNDGVGPSALYSFAGSGAASLANLGGIGNGFYNAGLALAAPVPEPGALLLALAGLPAVAFAVSRRRARREG